MSLLNLQLYNSYIQGYPILTKDETVKTTRNFKDMTIPIYRYDYCLEFSLSMGYLIIKKRKKLIYSFKEFRI